MQCIIAQWVNVGIDYKLYNQIKYLAPILNILANFFFFFFVKTVFYR